MNGGPSFYQHLIIAIDPSNLFNEFNDASILLGVTGISRPTDGGMGCPGIGDISRWHA